MSTLLDTANRVARSLVLGSPSAGWIGIDVGTRMIKLAQIRRSGDSWRLINRWVHGDEEGVPLTRELLATGALGRQQSALRSIRRLFRGRLAAASLSTSFVELRSFELPTGPWQETRAMIDQELAADASPESSNYEFDAWQAVPGDAMTKVIAVAINGDLSERVADDLLESGFECAVIDAVPCALARAVAMCDRAAATEPVAALDIGDTGALLTIIKEGRPIFYRSFRNCGLQSLIQPLSEKLSITRLECRQLLTRYGIPTGEPSDTGVAKATGQVVNRALENLVDELLRTSQYATHQLRVTPKRLWLFGGGGTIRNFAPYLARQTGLPTANWTLPGAAGAMEGAEPLFGVAAGLSALAWEVRGCT
jgi:Tfp pilus assembly PilM family ATPase